jgi:hypothetical protein
MVSTKVARDMFLFGRWFNFSSVKLNIFLEVYFSNHISYWEMYFCMTQILYFFFKMYIFKIMSKCKCSELSQVHFVLIQKCMQTMHSNSHNCNHCMIKTRWWYVNYIESFSMTLIRFALVHLKFNLYKYQCGGECYTFYSK